MEFAIVANVIVVVIAVIDFNIKRDRNIFPPNFGKSILTANKLTNNWLGNTKRVSSGFRFKKRSINMPHLLTLSILKKHHS